MDNQNELDAFRDYLRILATSQIGPSVKNKVDASDIVQQTLMRAHEGFLELRDRRPEVIAAWLRQILANEVIDAVRHFQRGKREVDREQNILKGYGPVRAWAGSDPGGKQYVAEHGCLSKRSFASTRRCSHEPPR